MDTKTFERVCNKNAIVDYTVGIILMSLGAFFKVGINLPWYTHFLLYIIAYVGFLIAYYIYMDVAKDSKAIRWVMLIAFLLAFSLILFNATSFLVFAYALPAVNVFAIFGDKNVLRTYNIVTINLVVLFARWNKHYIHNPNITEVDYEVMLIAVIVTAFCAMQISKITHMIDTAFDIKFEENETDPLTGCKNREFIKRIDAERFFNREDAAIILGDLNNFKQVNDTFGHIEGDIVLKELANCLKDVANQFKDTYAVRVGGDEFVIVTTTEFVCEIYCEVHKKVNENALLNNLKYNISIGLGIAQNEGKRPYTYDKLYKTADENMYKEKRKMKGE